MKKFIIRLIATAVISSILFSLISHKSDDYLRHRVFKLVSGDSSCSGEQVRAPSGKDYILTAGHCLPLADRDQIEAIDEDGKAHYVRVIKEDENSDLLLLSGVQGLRGLDLADGIKKNEPVRTFTHGGGKDSYKTSGEIVQETMIDIPTKMIERDSDCIMHKYKIVHGFMDIFPPITVCVLHVAVTLTTVPVIPGSSGGPMVNDYGDLNGVVSATGQGFSSMVRLDDIRRFLQAY